MRLSGQAKAQSQATATQPRSGARAALLAAGAWAGALVVKKAGGKVKKRFAIGKQPTNGSLTYTFTCSLKRGTYVYRVLAQDPAGHLQTRARAKRLIVL